MKPTQEIPEKTHPDLMTIEDLERRTQLSRSFWYARIADGSLRHFRMGPGQGGIRVSEEQYLAYLQRREQGGQEPVPPPAPPRIKPLSL